MQKGRWTRRCLNNVQNGHQQERKEKQPWLGMCEAINFLVTNQIFMPAFLLRHAKKKTKKE